jgi:hypothetical protein
MSRVNELTPELQILALQSFGSAHKKCGHGAVARLGAVCPCKIPAPAKPEQLRIPGTSP